MTTTLIIMTSLAMFFWLMDQPLILTFTLTLQTINIALMISMKSINPWFSYLLFMIFLSGMLIIFIYISSMASNNPPKYKPTYIFLVLLTPTPLMLYNLTTDNFNYPLTATLKTTFLESLYKMYSLYLNNLTLFLIIYLLLAFMVIIFIFKNKNKPSRT